MRLIIKGPLKDNVYNIMRRAGYSFEGKDEARGESVFARPARGYPRFHIYLRQEGEDLIFNLHLDQKRPIYKGASAHAGEYDGQTVEAEARRLEEIIKSN
ncbi:MAG: hypothetical protein Q7S70_02320 [bacterium]|nr:hypothetical protein [bacterium]